MNDLLRKARDRQICRCQGATTSASMVITQLDNLKEPAMLLHLRRALLTLAASSGVIAATSLTAHAGLTMNHCEPGSRTAKIAGGSAVAMMTEPS